MRIKSSFATLIGVSALVLLSACGPVFSIHPYYTDRDLTFDPQLVGTWYDPTDKNDKGSVVIEERVEDGHTGYTIRMIDPVKKPSQTLTLKAYLLKLGTQTFLDAVQSNIAIGDDDLLVLAAPAHMLVKVSLNGDVLKMAYLDDDWAKKSLGNGQISIAHENDDDGTPFLTASTQDLQKLALSIANEKEAFSELNEVRRKK